MELTHYNSYVITPGRWNPFNSADLKAMKIADAKIEADFSRQMADEMRKVNAEVPKRKRKPLTEDQKERKRQKNREWHAAHRFERNEASRAWSEAHKEEIRARSAENREFDRIRSKLYYEAHKEEILANLRTKRKQKHG